MRLTSLAFVGICPGNYESGGKRLSGRIRQGNHWVKAVLVQAVQAAAKTKNSYLAAKSQQIAADEEESGRLLRSDTASWSSTITCSPPGSPIRNKEGSTFLSWIERWHNDG